MPRPPYRKLLEWYDRRGRDLPWRRTRDPYRILVSEIMLQQTQVSRVLEFYPRWLETFPSWKSLAEASNADVLHAWAGLGYNRRGLMLRDIARQVVKRGAPRNREKWLELKGIGPYTSAALAAFSLRERTLPIDTNIRRVLGRYLLALPYPQPEHDTAIEERVDDILPTRGRHYDIPQAIFDLATMHCTKAPDCSSCPLRRDCPVATAFMNGEVEIPKRMTKKPGERIHRDKKRPDRIFRGRILKLVRESGPIAIGHVGPSVDPDYDLVADEAWMLAMLERLEKDGMIERARGRLRLAK